MNTKTKRVFQGFIQLTEAEKKDLLDEIKKYTDGTPTQKRVIVEASLEDFRKSTVNFGPMPSGCPCCGK